MKKTSIILTLLIIFVVISGCAIYRSKFFEPNSYLGHCYRTDYKIGVFENWNIYISFYAYKLRAWADKKNNNFNIEIIATTFDTVAFKARETKYKPKIRYVKVFYGEDPQKELKVPNTKHYVSSDYDYVSLSTTSGSPVNVPPEIKSVTVITEIELIDEKNKRIVKKYIIPMKRKKESTLWLLAV